MTFRLILVLLFAVVAWEQLANASKIAYKKPLYGKPAYTAKEKRLRMRPASIPSTTAEPDWPASVEFLINTTPTTTATSTMRAESSTATIIESSTLAQDQQLERQLEQKQVAESNGTTSTVLSIITTPSSVDRTLQAPPMPRIDATQPVPCTCGVFLSSQIQNGLPETPLIHNEMDRMFQCDAIGRKQCQTKCLEAIVQHLPNSANIVCATLGRDCHKERAYLFIKNCHNQWVNTNLQAGREYCCKQGVSYRCPLLG